LGDLGHRLDPVGCQFLEDCDILLALAGGPPTIALPDLRELIKAVRPHLVIPMHYKTPKVNLNLLSLEEFLMTFTDFPIENVESSSLAVTRAILPKQVTLCTLQHAR
jgi:L-ascorbate metabolism protein UlaG (beta-lactamase superfamily)